ncbi:MAG: hypothetical protein R3C19_10425 [Planctomycetaceae bacterium]
MEIRFLHADHLRLASSVRGIADAPGWLKTLAAGAFRQATRNLIEQAIATRAHFVVIAGSITDSDADLEPVVRWLDGQFDSLRNAQIPVVAWAANETHRSALSRICSVVLTSDQRLDVCCDSLTSAGQLRFSARPMTADTRSDLTICAGQSFADRWSGNSLRYQIQPSRQHQHANRLTAGNGVLTASAGATQAQSPDERHACGCLLVTADTATQSLTAKFLETDVLRFSQQHLSLDSAALHSGLRECVGRVLSGVGVDNERTLLVDWVVSGAGRFGGPSLHELSEARLLRLMRNDLQSGHRGAWPRSVRYQEDLVSVEIPSLTLAMREFLSVVRADSGTIRTRCGETWAGLELLSRAA